MARLPTKYDLSQPGSLRSGRAIATFDTTGIGRGMAAAGQALAGLGADLKKQQNAVDIARAEAYKTEGLLGVQNEFQQDGDYATYRDRAPMRTSDVIKKGGELIRDRTMRERWMASSMSDAARTNDSIFDRGVALKNQAETVAFDDALETNRRIYVDPETDEAEKARARADIEASIQAGLESGLLTPEQADQRRQTYLENADFNRGQLAIERDPSIISKPLPKEVGDRAGIAMAFFQSRGYTKAQAAGIVGNLIAESNLRPSGAVGDNGTAFGIAQWRGERLTRLKRFANANGRDWQDYETQLAFVDSELQSHETDAYKALKNAKTVDEATAAFISYERPAGWTANNPRGGHNYSGRLKFAARAAGEEVDPEWFQRLSPEQQFKLRNEADTVRNRKNVELQGYIETVTTNAPSAIQNTGRYDGQLPTIDQFVSAYGPQDGVQKFNSFNASIDTAQTAYDMRTMSTEEIRRTVQDAVPTSSGDDAALQDQQYRVISSAAEATLKARNADPAGYTQRTFPEIAGAWENIDAVPNGYQNALAATAAAQRQLGIENMRLLPASIADTTVNTFKDEKLKEEERIGAVTQAVLGTSDPQQRKAVFDQLVEAGLPDITEGALEAFARGDEGAGRRLFQAAMIDPSQLPGQSPERPADIDQAIQANLMDTGQIGDVYYGLSDGTTDNFIRAQRDQKLINNAVQVRIRRGESLSSAIEAVSKDLYGDVKVVTGNYSVNAQILMPNEQDPQPVLDGLERIMPIVEEALRANLMVPAEAPTADSTKAILEATANNYVSNVMAEGYFRNSGDGYVFMDPYTGTAVSDEMGQPIVFTLDQAPPATADAVPMSQEERERRYLEEMYGGFGMMGGGQ